MTNIARAFLCASALAAAAVVAGSAVSGAKAQTSPQDRYFQKQQMDARRERESFNKMWNPREANTKAHRDAQRRTLEEWRRQR